MAANTKDCCCRQLWPVLNLICNIEFNVFQAEGVDISKFALYFTLDIDKIPTTLVSTASIGNLQKNIDAVSQKLTNQERTLLEYIMDLYVIFDKLYNIFGISIYSATRYYNRGHMHLDKVDQLDYRKITLHCKKVCCQS